MVLVIVSNDAFANNSNGLFSVFALCSCFVLASKFPTATSLCGAAQTGVLFKTGTRLVSFIREYYHALLWDATPTEEWGRNVLVSSIVCNTEKFRISFGDFYTNFLVNEAFDGLLNNNLIVGPEKQLIENRQKIRI